LDYDHKTGLASLKSAITARTLRCTLAGSGFALVALGAGLMLYASERQASFPPGSGYAGWVGRPASHIPALAASAPIFGWGVAFLTLGAGCLGVAVPLLLEGRQEGEEFELGPNLVKAEPVEQGPSSGSRCPTPATITTPEAQIALDRNELRAAALAARYWMRDYGRASGHEANSHIGRYRLKDGTDILAQQEGASVRLCMPEELLQS
jgi:hypothetical protein